MTAQKVDCDNELNLMKRLSKIRISNCSFFVATIITHRMCIRIIIGFPITKCAILHERVFNYEKGVF